MNPFRSTLVALAMLLAVGVASMPREPISDPVAPTLSDTAQVSADALVVVPTYEAVAPLLLAPTTIEVPTLARERSPTPRIVTRDNLRYTVHSAAVLLAYRSPALIRST